MNKLLDVLLAAPRAIPTLLELLMDVIKPLDRGPSETVFKLSFEYRKKRIPSRPRRRSKRTSASRSKLVSQPP